jgi:hypothetical protein
MHWTIKAALMVSLLFCVSQGDAEKNGYYILYVVKRRGENAANISRRSYFQPFA